jgi:hypothetical protein
MNLLRTALGAFIVTQHVLGRSLPEIPRRCSLLRLGLQCSSFAGPLPAQITQLLPPHNLALEHREGYVCAFGRQRESGDLPFKLVVATYGFRSLVRVSRKLVFATMFGNSTLRPSHFPAFYVIHQGYRSQQ